MKVNVFFLLSIFLFVNGCKSLPSSSDSINGMVYNWDSEPLSGVAVFRNDRFYCNTDLYGHFYVKIQDIQDNCNFKFVKGGYRSVELNRIEGKGSLFFYVKMKDSRQLIADLENEIRKCDYTKGLMTFEEIVALDHKNNYARYLGAIAAYKLENFDRASEILSKIEDSSRNEYEAHLQMLLDKKRSR